MAGHSDLVESRDPWDQSTLLHFSCVNAQNRDAVEALLKAGCDPDAKNDLGQTPLHLAYEFAASKEVIDLLLKYGARSDVLDVYGNAPKYYEEAASRDKVP